jgi:hypothetical protein
MREQVSSQIVNLEGRAGSEIGCFEAGPDTTNFMSGDLFNEKPYGITSCFHILGYYIMHYTSSPGCYRASPTGN